jgi:hypothetical protein
MNWCKIKKALQQQRLFNDHFAVVRFTDIVVLP